MTRNIFCILVMTLLTAPAFAQMKDTYVIVKQNDFGGEDSYSVLSEREYRMLDRELRQEGFMATRARIMATKVWNSDPEKEGRFPAGMISARRASKVGRVYRDREDAEAKLSQLEDRLIEKEKEDAEREKRRDKNREQVRNNALRGGNSRSSSRNSTMNAATRDRLKKRMKERDQENEMREQEREMERDTLQSDAISVYAAQIELLKNPPEKESEGR